MGYCEELGVSLIRFSIFSCNEEPSTKWLLIKFVDNTKLGEMVNFVAERTVMKSNLYCLVKKIHLNTAKRQSIVRV